MAERPLDPRVGIGHVHLKVADIDRSLSFYCDILGFELITRLGLQAAFLSAGGYHHHIGLNTWETLGAGPAPRERTGIFHFAILYPDRAGLADAVDRLRRADWPLTGASDHGVSEAVYTDDPDGIGVELYRDRPRDEWPVAQDGSIRMFTEPLDLRNLMAELRD